MNRGFTLVELLVALLLTSIVALIAHQLLAGVVDSGAALRRSLPAPTAPTYGREWALEACRTLEVGTPGAHGFEGTPSEARFEARLPTADGWVERQSVTFSVHPGSVGVSTSAISATIVDSVTGATLDYLVDGSGEGGWVTGWSSPVSAPIALRARWIRADVSDTLLCPIGARG